MQGKTLSESDHNTRFSLTARCQSVRHALRGIKTLLREQHNARVHLVIALAVIAAGFVLQIDRGEWLIVVLLIGWVLSLEAFNSALEYLCDLVNRDEHPLIGKAKDVAAAAVLISALSAALIGVLIFLPRVWSLLIH